MDLDESPPSSKCSNDSSDNAVNNNLRIKCVSEINSDPVEEESVSSVCCSKTSPISKTKRKLPAWMMMSPGSSSGSDSSSSKKTKTLNNADDAQEFPQMDVDPSIDMIQETAAPAIHNEPDDHDAIVDSTAVALTPHNDATLNPAVHTTTSTVISTTSLDSQPSGSSGNPLPSVKIKSEDNEAEAHQTSIVNSSDVNPLIKVKKEEATSSTREACKFGIRCYRRNPQHRLEMAHPGDHDYRRPNFPTPPDGTPDCPFGDLCYRRNPVHFKQFSHPPST